MLMATLFAMALVESPVRTLGPASAETVTIASVCDANRRLSAQKSEIAARGKEGIAGLPHSMGRRFKTLDAYLTFLECFAAPIDLPWWRETEPGVYRQMTTATNSRPEIASRAELMKRFGFSR